MGATATYLVPNIYFIKKKGHKNGDQKTDEKTREFKLQPHSPVHHNLFFFSPFFGVGLNERESLERERENRQNTSQCIVPNWNLSPRRQEPVEPEEGNRSSHVHSLQNYHHHSLSPHLVSMSEHEIAELTWANGLLTMHGLGGLPPCPPAKPAWCQPSDTLESIVRQATLHKQIPAPNLQAHVCASSAAADQKCVPPVVGKRPRSDSDQGRRNNICCTSSMQDVSTCASASATFCKENDTTLMTWASFESPQSFKTKTTEDDLAWLSRSEKQEQEQELDTKCEIGRSNSTRRTRAAAVHNQSERKRRDKINQKMKALQKLVPNACKTDKASVLDEVIEYLKQLQAQVQLMSMRNIPQMIMPFGVQQQLQMSIMARMGMGLGLGIGNMARTTPQPPTQFVHPTPPTIVPPPFFMHPMVQPQAKLDPAANASVPLPDPFWAYLAQTMNMDLYNKMAGLYRQQANPNTQAGSNPSQSNNVQTN